MKRRSGMCWLVQQVAKGAKDSLTEVIRSGDLISYTAEEGVRWLGEVGRSFQPHSANRQLSMLHGTCALLVGLSDALECGNHVSKGALVRKARGDLPLHAFVTGQAAHERLLPGAGPLQAVPG